MSEKMGRIEDIQRTLMRKFSRIEYTHVAMPNGYADTERKYRRLRDLLTQLDGVAQSLENYEHGSAFFKQIKKGIQYLNERTSLEIYKNLNIYESAAATGKSLKEVQGASSAEKDIAEKFKASFEKVSKSKEAFNEKIAAIRKNIKEIKDKSKSIDSSRREAKNLRYDAESAAQSRSEDDDLVAGKKNKYSEKAEEAHKTMKDFISSVQTKCFLRDIGKEYRKHLEEAADSLKKLD